MSNTRFRFLLRSNNDTFNETVSLLFSSIAQSKTKGDIVKLVRTSLTETVGSEDGRSKLVGRRLVCDFGQGDGQGDSIHILSAFVQSVSFISHYQGYCCVVYDNEQGEEIVLFRPSSMPITEKIGDTDEIDAKEWKCGLPLE